MTGLDWAVLLGTIAFIVIYGAWKTRGPQSMESFLRGDASLRWPTIGLSVMATQASAITFLSIPGLAYEDGMRFVQFYFGLPLAMIVICAVFIPIYYRLKVYTAYEYLEHRFDSRVRYLGATLFLIQRGLAAGITIYAPAIILSTILGWPLGILNVAIGVLVIIYTVSGGTTAVSQTQKHQMVVMMGGILVAAVIVVMKLPTDVTLPNAVSLAGALGRMNVVSFELDPNSRYTFWSGITGGFFLALSYFGTDQSQVQRYLSGRSVTESRLGLVFNGFFKVPMQFIILFIGVMVFVFHLFNEPPVLFNQSALDRVSQSERGEELERLQAEYSLAFSAQRSAAEGYVSALNQKSGTTEAKAALVQASDEANKVRDEARKIVADVLPKQSKDSDYMFLGFVLKYLPRGLVGLLIAVILSAAMSSTASELSALGTTTTVDLYKRIRSSKGKESNGPVDYSGSKNLLISKLFTAMWGVVAIAFASFASMVDNLIEAVNILGSIFYGTVLGLFLVAFFLKRVSSTPVFIAALIAQVLVILLYFSSDLGFLWFNLIGCMLVVVISLVLQAFYRSKPPPGGVRVSEMEQVGIGGG